MLYCLKNKLRLYFIFGKGYLIQHQPMLIGFIFWYRGLSMGGIAAVGQLQLLQPFFGLALAGWLLQETIQPSMIAVMAGVLACVFGAKRFSR